MISDSISLFALCKMTYVNTKNAAFAGLFMLLVFFSVRRFADGFHARTRMTCFLVSILIIIGSMVGNEIINNLSFSFQITLLLLSMPLVLILVPVQNERKKLCNREIKMYRK